MITFQAVTESDNRRPGSVRPDGCGSRSPVSDELRDLALASGLGESAVRVSAGAHPARPARLPDRAVDRTPHPGGPFDLPSKYRDHALDAGVERDEFWNGPSQVQVGYRPEAVGRQASA